VNLSAPTLRATLRRASGDAERNAAIAAWLAAKGENAPLRPVVIAEGLLFDREGPGGMPLVGLAAGCPCCTGLLTLRVVLGRTLRRFRPDAILLLTTQAEHLPRLRRLLEDGELGLRFEVDG